MGKWIGAVGLLVWVAGMVAIALTLSWDVVTEEVCLRLTDGAVAHGTLCRPRVPQRKLAAVVLAHGAGLARQSCLPAFAVPFARNGYLAVVPDRPPGGSGAWIHPARRRSVRWERLDRLAERDSDWVWLLSVWQTGPA